MLVLLKKLCYNRSIMKGKRILAITSLTLISAALAGNAAFALTEQSEAALEFTFAPSLTLSVSDSDLIISDLIPGTSDISNTVDVTVTTNSVYGYALSATTGNTTNPTRNLVRDSSNYLESIAVNSSTSTLSNDTWGYTIDGGATYSGLPLYTSAATELNFSYGPVNAAAGKTSFAIGAKASTNKAAGNYTNVVNFTAVAKVSAPTTLQEIVTANCPTSPIILYDNRDNTAYHIQKLADGKCWMLDNLALDLTNSTVLNNMTATNTNASATALNYLKNGGAGNNDKYASSGVASWTGSSYPNPLVNMSYKDTIPSNAPENSIGYNKVGGYYNFCAASAGSYCYGGTSSGDSTEDICPVGWKIPSRTEYETVISSYSSDYDTIRSALSLPLSGYNDTKRGSIGVIWTSTLTGPMGGTMADLWYDNSNKSISPGSQDQRYYGFAVRCITK